MYALVIFTVTFMAVLNTVFQASAPELAAHAGGTYDLVVDSNRSAPIATSSLNSRDDVAAVSEVRRGSVDVRVKDADSLSEGWSGSAISDNWSTQLAPLTPDFDPTFPDQESLWTAVTTGQMSDGAYWIVAPEYSGYEVGQVVELGTEGEDFLLGTVGGLARNSWMINSGIYFTDDLSAVVFGDERPVNRHYVALEAGADAESVADAITASSPEQGVDARTFLSVAKVELNSQEGFLTILQGYLGLGLMIGIAGLSVVLVRSVRERRRQLGMLKAVGVPIQQTQRAFLLEAAFIGSQGVVLGIGLGVLSAWQVLTRSTAFEEDLSFAVPGAWLVGLGVLAMLASLAAAVGPARRAGKIPPAVALRITG